MKYKVVSFDGFAHVCPYFTSKYDVNNGYGCKHPKQQESGPDKSGIERGKCYCWSCPLGIEPDEEAFKNPDVDWDGITRDDCTSSITGEFSVDGEYIMVNIGPGATDEERKVLACCERYINRYNSDWKERGAKN